MVKSKSFRISDIADFRLRVLSCYMTQKSGLDYNQTDVLVTALHKAYDQVKEDDPVALQVAEKYVKSLG